MNEFKPLDPPATPYAVCVPALTATVGWAPTRSWADDIAQAWLNSPGGYTHVEIWHDGLRLWSSLDETPEMVTWAEAYEQERITGIVRYFDEAAS